MIREANVQEAIPNVCEVKVSFNREGMCNRHITLTMEAFMNDWYEKVDLNDDLFHKP